MADIHVRVAYKEGSEKSNDDIVCHVLSNAVIIAERVSKEDEVLAVSITYDAAPFCYIEYQDGKRRV